MRRLPVAHMVAAGLLLPWSAPAAHACSRVFPMARTLPPADAVVFYGTATTFERVMMPAPGRPDAVFFLPTWTFAVDSVAQGRVAGAEVVVTGTGSNCDQHYATGVGQRAVARPDPTTGRLVADWSPYLDVGTVLPTPVPFPPPEPFRWAEVSAPDAEPLPLPPMP